MAIASTVPLKEFRTSLEPKISQEDMARKAGVVLQTYRNAENGKPVLYATALAILKAMNAEREARGLIPISLEQLGLR